jgi:uncharacterized protein with HEPN domain
MKERIRDKSRLEHILMSIENVFEFTHGMTFDDYTADKKGKFAVVKNLEIIGEAAYKLSENFKEKHIEIVWERIIKMRHVLVHGYYQVEDFIVWEVIQNDLQSLKEKIQLLYDNEQ